MELQFEIIEDVIPNLSRVDEPATGRISHYQRIIAFCNVLLHGYSDVDDRLVRDVIDTNFPVFLPRG